MADSQITLSLGDGATYDVYATIFRFLAGKAEWQRLPQVYGRGWNVALNGIDLNIFDVDDDGVWGRPPTDDTWETFGEDRFIPWDEISTIVIF